MKKIKNLKGFTLIELLVVLSIGMGVMILGYEADKRKREQNISYQTATQMKELSSALSKHISLNFADYIADPGNSFTVSIADLQANNLLPNNYQNRTPFGGTFEMQVVKQTSPDNVSFTGLITTSPWEDDGGEPRYNLLGLAVKEIGAQGGMTYFNANQVSGLNGGWVADSADFSSISDPGQLAVRVYSDEMGFDNIYLRRDGILPMLGNLDMDQHDINNVRNLTVNGMLNANSILANQGSFANVFSNYIRNEGGIDTAQITGIGDNSAANFAYISARTELAAPSINVSNNTPAVLNVGVQGTADIVDQTPSRGVMNVQDIYLRDARGSGTWLSDRMPKMVSRGIYFVTDGDEILKPNTAVNADNNYTCNYGAARNPGLGLPSSTVNARVEIIPQTFFTQGKADGNIDFTGTLLFADPATNIIYGTLAAALNPATSPPGLNVITNLETSATDLGTRWRVNITNWGHYNDTYPYNSGWALAHVYCDYS